MKKTALDAILAKYEANGGWLAEANVKYGGYLFQYSGSHFGYVWRMTEKYEWGDPDTEHEYGWNSFEDFLNDTMTEVGMTFREVLTALPAEAVYDLG